MNCKNCGTPIQPGALRCPTCNIEYSKSDALDIPEVPTEALSTPILPDDEINSTLRAPVVEEVKPVDPNVIVPIEMPIATEINIPVVTEIQENLDESQLTVEEKKKLFPDERGSNKIVTALGILIILAGAGFFIYATFINKKIVDEIVYYFNPDARPRVDVDQPKEDNAYKPTIVKLEDVQEFEHLTGTKEEIAEMIKLFPKNVDKIIISEYHIKIIVQKETVEKGEVDLNFEKKMKEKLDLYEDSANYIISVLDKYEGDSNLMEVTIAIGAETTEEDSDLTTTSGE